MKPYVPFYFLGYLTFEYTARVFQFAVIFPSVVGAKLTTIICGMKITKFDSLIAPLTHISMFENEILRILTYSKVQWFFFQYGCETVSLHCDEEISDLAMYFSAVCSHYILPILHTLIFFDCPSSLEFLTGYLIQPITRFFPKCFCQINVFVSPDVSSLPQSYLMF